MLKRILIMGLFSVTFMALAAGPGQAQIVNVQPLLGKKNSDGFQMELGGTLSHSSGNVNLLLLKAGLLMTYKAHLHRLISSTSGRLTLSGGDPIQETVFTHLRWQWSATRLLTWEVYTQAATDRFRRLGLRALGGTGPRFELVKGPAVSFAVGLSYMFEVEWLNANTDEDDPQNIIVYPAQEDINHRASLYFTGRFAIGQLVALVNTTYFQPRLDAFASDFRISTDLDLVIKLKKNLALSVGFDLYYDHDPRGDVEPLDMKTSVAITVSL